MGFSSFLREYRSLDTIGFSCSSSLSKSSGKNWLLWLRFCMEVEEPRTFSVFCSFSIFFCLNPPTGIVWSICLFTSTLLLVGFSFWGTSFSASYFFLEFDFFSNSTLFFYNYSFYFYISLSFLSKRVFAYYIDLSVIIVHWASVFLTDFIAGVIFNFASLFWLLRLFTSASLNWCDSSSLSWLSKTFVPLLK